MRTESGGYRRDHLRALAQRVEVDAKEVRIMARKASCCARSSRLQAQKRRVLACPVLYRSGAPAWMKLITTFPLEYYDIPPFGLLL
jgi:hypothetical protein